MAIVTLAEVKTYLQISDTSQDTLIDALIPQVEQMFLKIRGIPFFTMIGDTTDTSADIEDVHRSDNDSSFPIKEELYYGQIIEDKETGYRATVDSINEDDSEITVDTNASATSEAVTFTIYPVASQLASSKIVGYFLSTSSGDGLKSESIGTYSYAKQDLKSGLPMDITMLIEEYQHTWET
jgi:hypothetical protein